MDGQKRKKILVAFQNFKKKKKNVSGHSKMHLDTPGPTTALLLVILETSFAEPEG
jgi:hypothetical protein